MATNKRDYTAKSIQVIKGLEAVRRRPAMYVGSTSERGLHHILYEVIDNSIDEVFAEACDKINVTLHDDGSVSVEDNGSGVPEEIRPRIFESYFTTKPVGVGTGIGLSISKSIVERHNGRVWYETGDLGGARFVAEFPMAAGSADEVGALQAPGVTIRRALAEAQKAGADRTLAALEALRDNPLALLSQVHQAEGQAELAAAVACEPWQSRAALACGRQSRLDVRPPVASERPACRS